MQRWKPRKGRKARAFLTVARQRHDARMRPTPYSSGNSVLAMCVVNSVRPDSLDLLRRRARARNPAKLIKKRYQWLAIDAAGICDGVESVHIAAHAVHVPADEHQSSRRVAPDDLVDRRLWA